MTYKTLTLLVTAMLIAFVLNIVGAFGSPITSLKELAPMENREEREETSLSQAHQIASYLTSFNASKGSYHYHLEAGCKDSDSLMPELYIQFKIHDLICSDCSDMLKYEIIPMLCLISAEWEKITGNKVINLINREDRLMWIYFSYNQIKMHDPYMSKEYSHAY